MKTFRYMTIAVMAMMMAGCSNNDINAPQPAVSGEGIPFTATISMGSGTRTVLTEGTDDNSKNIINAAWKQGDKVALVYSVGEGKTVVTEATVAVTQGGQALVSATLDKGVTDGANLRIVYPYSAVNSDANDVNYGEAKTDFFTASSQLGTLEDIAENWDVRSCGSEISVTDGKATLAEVAQLESDIAIWKFTFKCSPTGQTKDLSVKQLTVKIGSDAVATVKPTSNVPTLYVAIGSPCSDATITLEALDPDDFPYAYSKTGITLAEGKYYESTVMMAEDWLSIPLTLEATIDDTEILVKNETGKSIQYQINGKDLITITSTENITGLKVGDIVQFFSKNSSLTVSSTNYINIKPNKTTYVYGNVMSLIDDENNGFANDKTIAGEYALYYLFNGANKLASHDNKPLLLPATTLAKYCYYSMFNSCTGLKAAPALPAMTLAEYCYSWMFAGCSELKTLPENYLPATTLADYCYEAMFILCTGLTTAPVLHAKTLVKKCYSMMFSSCTQLSSVTCLATDISAEDCLSLWFNEAGKNDGCERKLYVVPSMTNAEWQLGTSGIEGKRWSCVEITE